MQQGVQAESVVVLTFVVVDAQTEEILDDAWATQPYAFIHGRKQMPRGFEQGIAELKSQDVFEFDVPPELAYGDHNSQHVQKVEPGQLPPHVKPGMVVHMEVPGLEGIAPPLIFHVTKVTEKLVHLDGNHPFAGKTLRFMGKIREVRPASAQELETGRINRPG